MPSVMVGGVKTPVSWQEYFAAILPEGTPVEWKRMEEKRMFMSPLDDDGVGTTSSSWFYDGVNLIVDVGGKRHSLMLGCAKYRLRRLRDRSRLVGSGMNGEGI